MRGDAPRDFAACRRSSNRSPHARGCTAIVHRCARYAAPFPACAGMHRTRSSRSLARRSVPRMRGDAPFRRYSRSISTSRSPHARGCTACSVCSLAGGMPFPACAGMHRRSPRPAAPASAVPRMRGDAPFIDLELWRRQNRSPHARGCTGFPVRGLISVAPFPACAGMHRCGRSSTGSGRAVPRMRGDAPQSRSVKAVLFSRSPHARGCTAHHAERHGGRDPFPACAGMHRFTTTCGWICFSVPRMRGDAPFAADRPALNCARSPHARGSSVLEGVDGIGDGSFPACAGMHRWPFDTARLLNAVPRMRGDAPALARWPGPGFSRSPHARGCTGQRHAAELRRRPFPACAGMHRSTSGSSCRCGSVPRMRGDAPRTTRQTAPAQNRSPHARGCTV